MVTPEHINTYVKSYSTALNFYQNLFEKFVSNGYNLSKKNRANSIWDKEIMHIIGHSINSEKITFVTSDKQVLKAGECRAKDYIQDFDEYQKTISFL